MKRTEIWAERNIHRRGVEVSVIEHEGDQVWLGEPVKMRKTKKDEGVRLTDRPTLVLGYPQAQMLLDELIRVGIRPSSEVSPTGELSATQRHLNDMRSIVSAKLEIELE